MAGVLDSMGTLNIDDFLQHSFDFLIIGGGTAGLTLAARLSEDPDVQVGVIEAGISRLGDPKVELPSGVGMILNDPDYDWRFQSTPQVRDRSDRSDPGTVAGTLAEMRLSPYRRVPMVGSFIWHEEKCSVGQAASTSWLTAGRVQEMLMTGQRSWESVAGRGLNCCHIIRKVRSWSSTSPTSKIETSIPVQ